jgi:hypothetical protein
MSKNLKIIIAAVIVIATISGGIAYFSKSMSESAEEKAKTADLKSAARQVAVNATQCSLITEAPTASAGTMRIKDSSGLHGYSSIRVPVTDNSIYDSSKYETSYDTEATNRDILPVDSNSKTEFAENSVYKDGAPPKTSNLRGTATKTDSLNIRILQESITPRIVTLDIYFTAEVKATESKNSKVVNTYIFNVERYCGTVEYKQTAAGIPSDPRTIITGKRQAVEVNES